MDLFTSLSERSSKRQAAIRLKGTSMKINEHHGVSYMFISVSQYLQRFHRVSYVLTAEDDGRGVQATSIFIYIYIL